MTVSAVEAADSSLSHLPLFMQISIRHTDSASEGLFRLPHWVHMTPDKIGWVVDGVREI